MLVDDFSAKILCHHVGWAVGAKSLAEFNTLLSWTPCIQRILMLMWRILPAPFPLNNAKGRAGVGVQCVRLLATPVLHHGLNAHELGRALHHCI